ncbi:MAG TPA: family 16 glycosylhydrolase, partial [Actinoplanes sp.]
MHNARHRSDTSTWWIRPRALGALVVASAGLVVAIWVPGRNDTAEAAETRTTFADEFDGDRGAGLDATKWLLGGEPDAARQDGEGRLVLTRPMSTRIGFAESFGHAEASIKVRRAADALRAFGVVDRRGQLLRGKVEVIGRPAAPISVDDFHTYAVDWSGESVVWSLDGRPVMRLASAAADRPFGVVLNLALGDNGRRTSRMVVDFVRVTADASPPSSEPTSPPVTTAPTSAPTTAPP